MPPKVLNVLVADALEDYYREHVHVKVVAKRRVTFAMSALNRHLSTVDLAAFDIPVARKYLQKRLAEGTAPSTVRRELGVLQAAANHALRWKRLSFADKPTIELPAEPAPRRIWLYKDELSHLVKTAEAHNEKVLRFLQLAYHTASRKEAIERLRWAQIDIPARRINLQPGDRPITKKRRPIVPVSEAMADQLATMRKTAATDFVLGDPGDIRPAFDRVVRLAGLSVLSSSGLREKGRLTPHTLRHSRATHLLEAGKSPWAVASLLGDSVTTVLRVYGHACPNYLEEALS